MEVMHAPAGHNVQMGRLLQVHTGLLTLYERLPLILMLQPGPLPLPYIQGKSEGQYCPKSHDHCVKNNVVSTKAAPVLFQVVFHQDKPMFSPAIPTDNVSGTDPQSGSRTAPAA